MAGSLDALSVKELKEYCRQRGHTDFSACVEKAHLVDLARSLDAARSSAGPSAAGATEPPSPDPAKRKTSGVSGPEGWKNLQRAAKTLGVKPDATDEDVRSAYKYQAKMHHPDRNRGASTDRQKKAEERFKAASEAMEMFTAVPAAKRAAAVLAAKRSDERDEKREKRRSEKAAAAAQAAEEAATRAAEEAEAAKKVPQKPKQKRRPSGRVARGGAGGSAGGAGGGDAAVVGGAATPAAKLQRQRTRSRQLQDDDFRRLHPGTAQDERADFGAYLRRQATKEGWSVQPDGGGATAPSPAEMDRADGAAPLEAGEPSRAAAAATDATVNVVLCFERWWGKCWICWCACEQARWSKAQREEEERRRNSAVRV